ncbi:MAG: hypothetical protein OSA98_03650 [Rubripirellula sp.]|nr:hypothetical protein [Rubripirellula sp.]
MLTVDVGSAGSWGNVCGGETVCILGSRSYRKAMWVANEFARFGDIAFLDLILVGVKRGFGDRFVYLG